MGLFSELLKAFVSEATQENTPAEETYGGVPLSKLNSLASNYAGGRVEKRGDRLAFIFRSNKKREGHTVEYCITDGKLHQMSFVANYPGRNHFPEEDFMNAANARFDFKE